MISTVHRLFVFAIIVSLWLGIPRSLTGAEHEHEHPAPEKLGRVNFPTSCSPAHQKEFERAEIHTRWIERDFRMATN